MKKLFMLAFAILASFSALNAQEWQTDFNKAKEIASTEHKPIILVFQGSDWCAPCMKLNREIWSTGVFKTYAKTYFVMLQADFPRKKKNTLTEAQIEANSKLAAIYNKNGFFPFVVVLDAKGRVLGETGYKKTSPENYIDELNAFIK